MSELSPLWRDLLSQHEALDPLSSLADVCSRCRDVFPPEDTVHEKIAKFAESLKKDPVLLENWGKFRAVFNGSRKEEPFAEDFPVELFPDISIGLLLLLTVLSLIPEGENNFRKLNLPAEQFHAVFQDFRNALREYRKETGETGYSYGNAFAWFALRLITGEVLRFGRLEFEKKRSFSDIFVFRNRKDGTVCILIDGTFPVNEKGWRCTEGEQVSFSVLPIQKTDSSFTGHPVNKNGSISRERVTLQADLWQSILVPGDPVWYMHIPSDGPLRPELVMDSLERIRTFDQGKSKGVICSSWLFDPILPEILDDSSNLVRLQRMGFPLPVFPIHGDDVIRHVFGQKGMKGCHAVPWNTSLQKAMGRYLESGGKVRGGRFMFPEFCTVQS